jgi:hypothetical protein
VIEISYPVQMQVPAAVIERWFATAVAAHQIPPERLSARTPQDMATALENIGWICLASK